jgi:alkanesulfonate monooxygenase SsuD/methylene tetrahydromethanopterin reductase-like flavin-dependent oxidoreductase (luciferase family)
MILSVHLGLCILKRLRLRDRFFCDNRERSNMAQVQFGLIAPVGSPDQAQEFLPKMSIALDTIVGHFDSVWVADHLQFGESPLMEGWTMLTYLAALRPELRYGHLVLCQLFRNPALLAKMAATFQYMSRGNFILGLGAGWAEEEARAYHLPFPSPGQRVSELDEQVQIIKALWSEKNVTFEGEYHQVTNANCLPHPDPIPPILIAGFQPRMMNLVARHADWWNTGVETLEKTKERLAALDVACEKVGRDPKTLRRTAMIGCYCAPTEQKLKELTSNHRGQFSMGIVGTPSQVVEQFQPFVEAGIDYFMIRAGGAPHDLTSLEMLSHEVLPALNKK